MNRCWISNSWGLVVVISSKTFVCCLDFVCLVDDCAVFVFFCLSVVYLCDRIRFVMMFGYWRRILFSWTGYWRMVDGADFKLESPGNPREICLSMPCMHCGFDGLIMFSIHNSVSVLGGEFCLIMNEIMLPWLLCLLNDAWLASLNGNLLWRYEFDWNLLSEGFPIMLDRFWLHLFHSKVNMLKNCRGRELEITWFSKFLRFLETFVILLWSHQTSLLAQIVSPTNWAGLCSCVTCVFDLPISIEWLVVTVELRKRV